MNEEQVQEMESWYANNLDSKKLEIVMFGLVLLPFLAVFIFQQSSGARLCLLIFMGFNLLSSVIYWSFRIF